MTPKTGEKLLQALDLNPQDRKTLLLSLLGCEEFEKYENSTKSFLSEEELEAIAGWEHYAILSLLEIKSFKATLSTISKRP